MNTDLTIDLTTEEIVKMLYNRFVLFHNETKKKKKNMRKNW